MGFQIDLRPPDRYVLPDDARQAVAGNFGTLLQTDQVRDQVDGPVAAVGDIVSLTLIDLGIEPHFIVCDYKTQRGDEDPDLKARLSSWGDQEIPVKNPAASITRGAWNAVREAALADKRTRIVVDGEEDLLGIPAFLEMDVGSQVAYGAPGKGLVLVDITHDFQAVVAEILTRFQRV